MKRWINTKVTFEWDGEQYVETSAEGYNYEGEMALCLFSPFSGYGGGGGGVGQRADLARGHSREDGRQLSDDGHPRPDEGQVDRGAVASELV